MAGRWWNRAAGLVVGVMAVCGAAGGCLGPRALEQTRLRYNEAFLKTSDEQLLINIVRLRYGDSPVFVDLPSITSQFEVTSRLNGVSGRDGQGPGPTDLIGGDLFVRDAPTLSYHPREGREVARALMTPLPVEALRIIRAGANIEQLLLLLLNEINGVGNAERAVEMVPLAPDANDGFRHVVSLIGSLQRRGVIEFAVDLREDPVSDEIEATRVVGRDLVNAAKEGLVFRAEGRDQAVLKRRKRVLTIEVDGDGLGLAELGELTRVLRVPGGLRQYEVRSKIIEDDDDDGIVLPAALGDDEIVLSTRSVLQMMTFLSKGVCVPEDHLSEGIAPSTRDAAGCAYDWTRVTAGLFQVYSSKHRPKGAEVAVRYKDRWFYLREDDPVSRSTLAVLELLFSLQQIDEAEAGPLLTLPVGG